MPSSATLVCRPSCGACCTAPSITSPIPGMPNGKPAGVRCVQLADDNRCLIFGQPERPAFCGGLQPSEEMCGDSREYAVHWLGELERLTAPPDALAQQRLAQITLNDFEVSLGPWTAHLFA